MSRKDLPRELLSLYFPRAGPPLFVDVPRMNYLMVDGRGPPSTSPDFRAAIEALYGLAYTIKFGTTEPEVRASPVMPLEGRFWSRKGTSFPPTNRADWRWTLMLRQPDHVRKSDCRRAVGRLRARKNPSALARVRFDRWKEGRAVEVLYVGPYSGERRTIQGLDAFARSRGYRFAGRHHEIYLSDPRRTRPERLKTVLRHPIRRGPSLSARQR